MDSCEELYKFTRNYCDLTLGSRAIHSSCSNRSSHSPSLPKSDLADHGRCAGGSPCFRGGCGSCAPWGPSCDKQGAGKAPRGCPGGCSAAAAAPRPSSFLPSFPQQGAKEKQGTWHRYCCWTDLCPWFAFCLAFFFPVKFWSFEPECWRVFSPRR